jgi:hypothetical protein
LREAHACVAEWQGEYLEIWYHGQQPLGCTPDSRTRVCIQGQDLGEHALHGLQFGGLNWSRSLANAATFTHYAVAAAKRTGKPVKVLFDESHFHGGEETNGTYSFKVGFQKAGRFIRSK